MDKHPLVSIVITNYNRGTTIARAIESALAQDYPNLEIIVSDNCSTDDSHTTISNYIQDKRIKYYRNETNIGMLGNFKISFEERAKGEYITIVNSDDELINSKFISQSVDLINKYPNIVIVKSNNITSSSFGEFENKNDSYKEFYTGLDFLKQIDFTVDFGWTGILLHKKSIDILNIFENEVIAGDYFTNFKLLTIGNICFNKHASYKYFLHKQNASNSALALEQIPQLFKELEVVFNLLINKCDSDNFTIIKSKMITFYFNSIYHFHYLQSRKTFPKAKQLMMQYNSQVLQKLIQQKQIKQLNYLFYFPWLGRVLTNIKKKIF
jgi:glycosyltransferase involved in cell wall biosynthesis